MTPEECMRICRLAKAASPAQAVDEYTPELWFMVLREFRYADAEQALTELAGDQEWIHVSHIKKRIKKIRLDRVNAFGELPDPPSSLDPENARAYNTWKLQTTSAIADGVLTEPPPKPEIAGNPEAFKALRELRAKADRNVREGLDLGPA